MSQSLRFRYLPPARGLDLAMKHAEQHSPIAPPLPQNLEAERAVLGAVLLDNKVLSDAVENLRPEDFFLDQHRRVFVQMIALSETQQAIDLVILTDELQRRGELEAVGGAPYLASLANGMPRVSNVAHYARIVKEKAALRSIVHRAERVGELALNSNGNVTEALAEIRSLCDFNFEAGTPAWQAMFHSFEEFERTPPLEFAIRQFLQIGGATMIGGLAGHGKTFIFLSIVKALLKGRGAKLWNVFDVEESAVRILYLIPESTLAPFKHRLRLFGLYDYLRPQDGRLWVRTLDKGPAPCLSDAKILAAAKGAHVILDTAIRFAAEGEENSASDNQRGLASDMFALLGAGARTVVCGHHSPKAFVGQSVMTLEGVLRGTGDIGATMCTAFGVKQIDAAQNLLHLECVKARDFEAPGPFEIIGRPFIDERGDLGLYKAPGECGTLAEEQPDRNAGGASPESRKERARRVDMVRNWLTEDPNLTAAGLCERFKKSDIKVGESAVKNYRKEALWRGDE